MRPTRKWKERHRLQALKLSSIEDGGMGELIVFLREHAFYLLQTANACRDQITATKLRELSVIVEEQAIIFERKMQSGGNSK